ncbi:S-layer homology domain-containing protein [Paenibacillus silvae]|uniref:S-layer homology domain-containing protein n=1 Tax=Paenibacillus silvae TaxID=1325358 RepID=UPI0025A20A67|nr:S-layer homology domain-containing protein [Paenibacillus silvae]MDM5280010.1 S-layer homology domain-containing protein [Paenibacillus silvae]
MNVRKDAKFALIRLQRLTKICLAIILLLALPFATWGAEVVRADSGDLIQPEQGYPKPALLTPTSAKITVKFDHAATLYFELKEELFPMADLEGTKSRALENHTYYVLAAGEERTLIFNNLKKDTDYALVMVGEGTDMLLQDLGQENFKTLETPDNVQATLVNNKVKLSWTEEAGRTYQVYKYEGSTAPANTSDWIDITNTLLVDNEVPDLVDGKTYIFAVTSTYHTEDEHFVSDYVVSNAVTPGLPAAPVTLTAQAVNGQVKLDWSAVPEVEYVVYMYQGSGAPQNPEHWVKVAGPMTALQYNVSNLTSGLPYVFAVRSSSSTGMSEFKVSASVTPQAPSSGGGEVVVTPSPSTSTSSSSSSIASSTAPQKEIIKVDVANGEQASTIDSLELSRTRGTDGTIKDELELNQSKAQSVIDQLKKTGSRTAVIRIPDVKDEVSQWDVKLAKESVKLFTEQGIELVISNPNVKVSIPAASLKDRTEDVYFRLVPVKKQESREAIEQRLLANEPLIQSAGTKNIQVLGRPMTIETNLQSRPVTIVLPVDSKQLAGVNPEDLGVYIEHSSGTKELVHGKLVTLNKDNNQQGIEIHVDEFSTFSVVRVKDWAGQTTQAQPYIRGYADGRFQPERFVTRAEMSALLIRVTGTAEAESEASFADVKANHWAESSIVAAVQAGYVKGYPDDSFKPEQAITRAELANVLQYLLKGQQTAASEPTTFKDVQQHWAQEAIDGLSAAGVITGYTDGTFRPEQPVTRAEAVTMINKLIGLQPASAAIKAWSDVTETHWAYQAIEAASIKE